MPLRLAALLALAALAAPTPRADDPAAAPPPEETLRRAREAQGGEGWEAIQGMRLAGTLEAGGLQGTIESLQDLATGRFRDRWALGPMTGASGWDGERAWSQDGSGVARVDGAEAARQATVSDAYRRAQGWWYPDRFPAAVKALGERRDGDRRFQALSIAPEGGRPFELWVGEDGRFDRWVEEQSGRPVTTFLSDWRQVGAVWVPFVQRASRGEDQRQYDQWVRLADVALTPAAPAETFALPAPPPPDSGIAGGRDETTVPFELLNGHVYVRARLDGKGPFRLLVDTGGVNIVTPPTAAALGLDAQGKLPGGGVGDQAEDIAIAKVRRVELGGAFLADQTFFVYALDAMAPVEGTAIDGLVGYELFRRFAARIDYQRSRLTLYRPEAFRYRGSGAVLPFVFNDHIPQVDGEIDGVPGKFDLDTGSRASLDLLGPFVEAHGLVERYQAKGERINGWGVGGPARGYQVRAGVLKLGPVEIPGPVTGLSTQRKGAFAQQAVAGNVGSGVLSRFTVYLDYPRQQVILEKNARFGRPDPADRSGLWLHLGKGAFEVVEAVPGTPAEEAGLRAGDRILAVDGAGVGGLSLHALRVKLREGKAGRIVRMRVEREGKAREVRLVLRELIQRREAG